MNDDPRRSDQAPPPNDDLEPLFGVAGRRPRLPDHEVEPIRAAARAAWRRQVRRTSATRGAAIVAALAAGLLVAVGLSLRRPADPPPPPPVGEMVVQAGNVAITGPPGPPGVLSAGSAITTGGDGRAALRLLAGPSVRIDVASAVRLASTGVVALDRGAVYVDSDPRSVGGSIEVATPLGSVRHAGTQFEVRLLGDDQKVSSPPAALRVAVREGAVHVSREGSSFEARAGAELTLYADGTTRRAAANLHGPAWEWTQQTAPPLEIEGATLSTFLDWVSRETGLPWRYSEPGLERFAKETILHGSLEDLTPEEALSVVLPGCGVRHRRVEQGLLLEPGARR